jgi:hypothetical protein
VADAADEVLDVVVALLVVDVQRDVILGRHMWGALPCSARRSRACMRRSWTGRVIPVVEEPRLPPRICLDPAPVEPSIRVDIVGGINVVL